MFLDKSNNMVKAKIYVFKKQFVGLPKETDLKLVEEELPALKNGAVYLSIDPYIRAFAPLVQTGSALIGSQVAKVIESKNAKYPVGQYVVGEFGWRTYTISEGEPSSYGFPSPWLIPDPENLPLSLFLGVLGMTGITAYFGFLEICQPQPGETVVITGAAGAVGSHVGQMAKNKGCTVIGVAGSNEKGKWLVDELKFDNFINYKDPDFKEQLAEAAPKGVDCYFDNVGGEISSIIINQMNTFGRVSVCGAISGYNDETLPKASIIQYSVVFKQLKIEGFIFHKWWDRRLEAIEQNKKWIKEGELKYRETVTQGFENTYKALIDMLQGGNFGKAIVKL